MVAQTYPVAPQSVQMVLCHWRASRTLVLAGLSLARSATYCINTEALASATIIVGATLLGALSEETEL
jgi:hypothetical protein